MYRIGLQLAIVLSMVLAVQAEQVQISVTDAELGTPVAARAYLTCDGEPIIPEQVPAYRNGIEEHFLLSGTDSVELDAAPCEIMVARGLEYHAARVSFQPEDNKVVAVPLQRWVSMHDSGWYSADMHVHRSPQDLAQILLAEDLNFAPAITYHVWGENVSEPFTIGTNFPEVVDPTHIYTGNSEEIERIQGGPGAVILHAQHLPIPFGGDEYYPPSVRFTQDVHKQGGYVSGDKAFWLDTPVNVALGEIDFIELNCNHFLPHGVDTDLTPWSHWPIEVGYDGAKGFALWMMDTYYRYLNAGFRLPLAAGSASGVKATPVGYNRVYVHLGSDPFHYDSFMTGLKLGRSFSTNGPLIDLQIDGDIGPGSDRALKRGDSVRVVTTVRSKSELEQVDLILNGTVFRTYPGGGKRELRIEETLSPGVSAWIAIRAFELAEKTIVFAHTSPAWLRVEGHPVSIPEDARYLMNQVDQLIQYTETRAVFQKAEHLEQTLAIYRQARAVYEQIANRN